MGGDLCKYVFICGFLCWVFRDCIEVFVYDVQMIRDDWRLGDDQLVG